MIDLALPSDFIIIGVLLILSFLIAIGFSLFFKDRNIFYLIFSILGNVVFVLNVNSTTFYLNNFIIFQYFFVFVWPLLNFLLILRYLKSIKS